MSKGDRNQIYELNDRLRRKERRKGLKGGHEAIIISDASRLCREREDALLGKSDPKI